MLKFVAVSIAAASIAALSLPMATLAADLVATPAVEAPAGASAPDITQQQASLRDALSEYLSLLMIRATFDVVDRADLEGLLADELRVWGGRAPDAGTRADLDRLLLAEGSYYLVSLSYTVKIGGAVFPEDKSEMVYTNDTIVQLDDLQRRLADTVAAGGDTLPIFVKAEQIRALTEGSADVPPELGVFNEHAAILDKVIETAARGTQT